MSAPHPVFECTHPPCTHESVVVASPSSQPADEMQQPAIVCTWQAPCEQTALPHGSVVEHSASLEHEDELPPVSPPDEVAPEEEPDEPELPELPVPPAAASDAEPPPPELVEEPPSPKFAPPDGVPPPSSAPASAPAAPDDEGGRQMFCTHRLPIGQSASKAHDGPPTPPAVPVSDPQAATTTAAASATRRIEVALDPTYDFVNMQLSCPAIACQPDVVRGLRPVARRFRRPKCTGRATGSKRQSHGPTPRRGCLDPAALRSGASQARLLLPADGAQRTSQAIPIPGSPHDRWRPAGHRIATERARWTATPSHR